MGLGPGRQAFALTPVCTGARYSVTPLGNKEAV